MCATGRNPASRSCIINFDSRREGSELVNKSTVVAVGHVRFCRPEPSGNTLNPKPYVNPTGARRKGDSGENLSSFPEEPTSVLGVETFRVS